MDNSAAQERIAQFERTCRAQGLPITVQRRTVFEAMLGHADHPTADQIYEQVRTQVPGISRTTVYRILETFVCLGLIRRICHHSSAARFDAKVDRHDHLVCMHCEKIIDLKQEEAITVDIPNVKAHGFAIADYCIHFRGICAACRSQGKKGVPPTARTDAQARSSGHKTRSRSRKNNG